MTRSCPPTVELLSHLFPDAASPRDSRVERHVAGCAECQAAIAELRSAANAVRISAPAASRGTSDCLDEETLAALGDGSTALAGATEELEHLLGCTRCRRELASTVKLLGDPAIMHEAEGLAASWLSTSRGRWRNVAALAGVAAAAAVIFAVARLVPPARPEPIEAYRELSVTGAAPPVPLAPIGVAAAPEAFRWSSVPRADRYRITVFDRNGSVIWEAQTRDTAIAVPGVIARMKDTIYLWRVEARVGWEDRWTASGLAEVTIHRGRGR